MKTQHSHVYNETKTKQKQKQTIGRVKLTTGIVATGAVEGFTATDKLTFQLLTLSLLLLHCNNSFFQRRCLTDTFIYYVSTLGNSAISHHAGFLAHFRLFISVSTLRIFQTRRLKIF
jgi:hypothetical protein